MRPYGQDRLIPIWAVTLALKQKSPRFIHKLVELLRLNALRPVYRGHGTACEG